MVSTTIEPLAPPQGGNTIGFCTYLDACNSRAWKEKLETLFPYNWGARYFAYTEFAILCPVYSVTDNNRRQQKTSISKEQ